MTCPTCGERPAVIFLHGGEWDTPAARGFAVFNADHTFTGGDPRQPSDEILALVAWVRTNATKRSTETP